jgi:hypothetical protein
LNIEVIDSNPFTKISINGKELLERPPIIKYPILAEKNTEIKAYNPITKLVDTINIIAKPDETRKIKLMLERGLRKLKK